MNDLLANVALPLPLAQLFTYSVPTALAPVVSPGSAVVVPFGKKIMTGIVMELTKERPHRIIKPIQDVADLAPLVSSADLALARWISEYYLAPIGEALRLFMPPGTGQTSKRIVSLRDGVDITAVRSPSQRAILAELHKGKATVQQLRTRTRITGLYSVLRDLADAEAIVITEHAARRIKEKYVWFFRRIQTQTDIALRGPKQNIVWNAIIADQGAETDASQFLKRTRSSLAMLRSLESKGLIELYQKPVHRKEYFAQDAQSEKSRSIILNDAQSRCVSAICSAVATGTASTFLLYGITGSGKTQVYIESIRRTLDAGKRAIVLIPEISLTPQTVRRFQAHFGEQVVWMHSRMSDGERQDAWRRAHDGSAPVVIGPRSALFAPLQNIGLIIVDEEHESSYKQFDAAPRYHARDVAIMRAGMHQAVVVLGSATPSIESFSNAAQGKYALLTLPERADTAVLPPVTIVNMVTERKRIYAEAKVKAKEVGKLAFENLARSISPELEGKIRGRLQRKEGIILLQNRRGFAPFIECSSCGHVEQCDHCSVTMTFHATHKHLRCHYCGTVRVPPTVCTECGGYEFRMNGFGTQRVEQELNGLFPEAVIARMDMDSTTRKGSHERILRTFGEGGSDILLGTQMVAKGLDFPRVTLVGVISADTQMMLPDFRSAERTFQLLTQVAGRAGRSTLAGEVVIQTSQPEHYALKHVQQHDYKGFYEEEVEFRRSVAYPPFSRIIVIEFKGKTESGVERVAQEAGKKFAGLLERTAILGPSPAVLSKIKNDYRWQIILKAAKEKDPNGTRARQAAARVFHELQSLSTQHGVRIILDVDPVGIL